MGIGSLVQEADGLMWGQVVQCEGQDWLGTGIGVAWCKGQEWHGVGDSPTFLPWFCTSDG